MAARQSEDPPASHVSEQEQHQQQHSFRRNLIRRRTSSSGSGVNNNVNNVKSPSLSSSSSPRRSTMPPSYARRHSGGESGSDPPPSATPIMALVASSSNDNNNSNDQIIIKGGGDNDRGIVEEEGETSSTTVYSSPLYSAEEEDEVARAAAIKQQGRYHHATLLPRMFSVTVPKRPDQPAGLTLSSLGLGTTGTGGGDGSSSARRASKTQTPQLHHHQQQRRERSSSIASSSKRRDSSLRSSFLLGGSTTSVIVSSISPQSPFHPSSTATTNTNNDDGKNSSDILFLQTKDEVLLINNHRVKDPKRAAQMIMACTSGSLTIVASRGERMDGMNYHLARLIPHSNETKKAKESRWQEHKDTEEAISGQYQLQLGGGEKEDVKKTICGMEVASSNNESLLRICSIQKTSPFARSGIKAGDVLLAVDGKSVKCFEDADETMLLMGQKDVKNTSNQQDRVVTLLVYSFWDLRHKVLREELQIEGESDNSSGNKQPWQATWSYMQTDEVSKNEHVILQIPNTTVTFQLDFDEDGTCSCTEPYKALKSIPAEEGHEPNTSIRRRQAFDCGHSQDSGFSEDDQSSYTSGTKSRHSRDEARAALELLYQKHIAPTIDALNYHTWRQIRLLANALDASSASSSDGKAHDEKGVSSRNFGTSDMELATTAAMATIRQQRKTRRSYTSEKSIIGDEITKPRGVTPPPKHLSEVAEKQAASSDPTLREEPECAQDVHTSSSAKPPASRSRRPSGEGHMGQESIDSFQEKLGKLQLNPSGAPSRLSKATPETSNVVQSKPGDQLDENQKDVPLYSSAGPSGLYSSVETNLAVASARDEAQPSPVPNRRRRPTGLRRRPSIVPVFKNKRVSMTTQISALSDSDESDSSASGTSTTSSSDSSYDSEDSSDSDDDDNDDESARPRKKHPARAQAADQGQSSGERRRPRHQRAPVELSSSTQMVLYNPQVQENTNNISSDNAAPPTISPQTNVPKLKRRLKMRNGDIREKYKVSPRIIGTGAFGTVRSCLNRQSREQYAVKSILKRGNIKNATLLKNEIALVQRVHHKNVVRVVDVIQDLEYIHIVMEECRGGDLFDKIVDGGVKLGEERACEVVGSLVDAIAYLHDRDIVHRDLKAEHIMLTNDDIDSPVKIIDFGLATIHSATDAPMTAFAGSAFTVAPEVVKRSYGKECDLWSVGVITYFLLTSRMPFNAKSDKEIFEKILSGEFGYPAWTQTGLSEEAKDFIDRLLVVDPKRRLTAKQALSHLWIRKHNQNRLATSMNSHEMMLVPVVDKSIVPVSNNDDEDEYNRGKARSALTPGRRRRSPVSSSNSRQQVREPPAREHPIGSDRRGSTMRRPAQPQQHRLQQRPTTESDRSNSRRSPRPTTRITESSTVRMTSSRGLRKGHDP